MSPAVAHHADIREHQVTAGDISFRRRRLAAAAGAARVGASHYLIAPGSRGMPVHVHGDEEEIVYVLGGEGTGYELAGQDPQGEALTYPLGPGDVVVHRPGRRPHTRIGGPAGLELIVFGSGSETSLTYLPRAGVMWAGARWVPLDAPHPFSAEAAAGPLRVEAVDPGAERPSNVVRVSDCDPEPFEGIEVRAAGRAGGAVKAGLNHVVLPAGASGAPAHCHALEEELFVVLAGSGTLTLGAEAHPLRAGDVVSRPPGTGVPHALTAGPDGLTYLVYGTREPGDAVAYPAAGTVRQRGLGVTLNVA